MKAHLGCWAWLCVAGCAGSGAVVVDGKEVARQRLDFTGSPYALRHHGAHPLGGRGPSDGVSGDGGNITGRVCGVDVQYDVSHKGDHVQLVGTLDNGLPSQLRAEDRGGVRVFTGGIGDRAVELRLGKDGVVGYVGRRPFQLVGDSARGWSEKFRVANFKDVDVTLRLQAPAELWAMPAADQAVVLPLMLACMMQNFEDGQFNDQTAYRFGGPEGAQPPSRLVLGTASINR